MSSPVLIAGQVRDVASGFSSREANGLNSPPSRHPSFTGSITGRDTGLNQRTATFQSGAGQHGKIVRKKLPWLEVNRPAETKVELPPAETEAKPAFLSERPSRRPVPKNAIQTPQWATTLSPNKVIEPAKPFFDALTNDPALRATGSTPSLRNGMNNIGRPRTHSLSSEPRPGVTPAISKEHIRKALGVSTDKQAGTDDYTPSEYSTTISSDAEHMPPTPLPDLSRRRGHLPKSKSASYERLVKNDVRKKPTLVHGEPHHAKDGRICATATLCSTGQTTHDRASPDKPDAPAEECLRAEKRRCRWDNQGGRYDSTRRPRRWSRGSGEPNAGMLLQARIARSPLRRSSSVPSLQDPREPSPVARVFPLNSGTTIPKPHPGLTSAGARKQTLHELPLHLMAKSSSSSSSIPPHLQVTSTESSSSSQCPLSGSMADITSGNPDVSIVGNEISSKGGQRVSLAKPTLPLASASGDTHGLKRETRSINRAISGFEHLMEDAVAVANESSQHNVPDEVQRILDEVSTALKTSKTAFKPHRVRTGKMDSPLKLSPLDSEESGASESNSSSPSPGQSSVGHTRRGSWETAPTLMTRSAQSSMQPLVQGQGKVQDGGKGQDEGKVQDEGGLILENSVLKGAESSSDQSMSRTPPQLYQPPSADSIIRDFAYAKIRKSRRVSKPASQSAEAEYGLASDYYHDHGESVISQPGVRLSISPLTSRAARLDGKQSVLSLPEMPPKLKNPSKESFGSVTRSGKEVSFGLQFDAQRTLIKVQYPGSSALSYTNKLTKGRLRELEKVENMVGPDPVQNQQMREDNDPNITPQRRKRDHYHPHVSDFFENAWVSVA